MFDCVAIGAQEKYGDTPEKQPEDEWVIKLWQQALEADCEVCFKENYDLPKKLPVS